MEEKQQLTVINIKDMVQTKGGDERTEWNSIDNVKQRTEKLENSLGHISMWTVPDGGAIKSKASSQEVFVCGFFKH